MNRHDGEMFLPKGRKSDGIREVILQVGFSKTARGQKGSSGPVEEGRFPGKTNKQSEAEKTPGVWHGEEWRRPSLRIEKQRSMYENERGGGE